MKLRKHLTLSPEAVAHGEKLAAERWTNLSQIIEEPLLAIPAERSSNDAYWPGPALKPVRRKGDQRHAHLKRQHRVAR